VGEIKTVLVVETDLMLDENDKGYDRAALTEMLDALAEFLQETNTSTALISRGLGRQGSPSRGRGPRFDPLCVHQF
jgi:hypothetical protein